MMVKILVLLLIEGTSIVVKYKTKRYYNGAFVGTVFTAQYNLCSSHDYYYYCVL